MKKFWKWMEEKGNGKEGEVNLPTLIIHMQEYLFANGLGIAETFGKCNQSDLDTVYEDFKKMIENLETE